jgi:hypothetical protein
MCRKIGGPRAIGHPLYGHKLEQLALTAQVRETDQTLALTDEVSCLSLNNINDGGLSR